MPVGKGSIYIRARPTYDVPSIDTGIRTLIRQGTYNNPDHNHFAISARGTSKVQGYWWSGGPSPSALRYAEGSVVASSLSTSLQTWYVDYNGSQLGGGARNEGKYRERGDRVTSENPPGYGLPDGVGSRFHIGGHGMSAGNSTSYGHVACVIVFDRPLTEAELMRLDAIPTADLTWENVARPEIRVKVNGAITRAAGHKIKQSDTLEDIHIRPREQ